MISALTTDLKQKWERVAQRLRAELGEDLYSSWFARMELEECRQGRLAVSVPTRFLKSWIENHYLSRLQKTGETELGHLDAVQVRVRTRGLPHRAAESQERELERKLDTGEANRNGSPAAAAIRSPQPMALDRQGAIDPNQTFESFIVGGSNQLAHAAVSRVADAVAGASISFNPLFIHAQSGLGKTHLLNAVCHRIRERRPGRKVMFLTAERFMYSFVLALRQRDTISFKDQFHSIDVLLIDDFQFLQGKTMQQEFCHAFNSLVDQRRQVIVAADVPPAQLDMIDQRMR
ncbi:MAG: DnaA ATPase domain-containing protein, partial [Aestuariivirga sp.]